MKASIIAAPFVEVPPKNYGGRERIINDLSIGLEERGLDVSLYCSADSNSPVKKFPISDTSLFKDPSYDHSKDREKRVREVNARTMKNLSEENPDLISCHDYDNPDLIKRLSKLDVPVVVSIAHASNPLIKEVYDTFKNSNNIYFHGLSKKHVRSIDEGLHYIYNGVNPENYSVLTEQIAKRNYFLSIGDMKPIKGHKSAISLSKKSGIPIILAGGSFYPESERFFQCEIEPNLDSDVSNYQSQFLAQVEHNSYKFDNGEVVFFGPASDNQKKILYSNAMFSQFLGGLDVSGNIEAFGLTSIESMMSGTPVIGAKGSVLEELVQNEGKMVDSVDQAIEEIPYLDNLDPFTIRESAKNNFSSSRMVNDYLDFFQNVLSDYYG